MTNSAPDRDAIALECRAFARHLADTEPTAYALACYERLLPSAQLPDATASQLIERALLAAGQSGGVMLRMADGYACLCRPRSALRRRLILLVAILENSPESATGFNTGDEGSFVAVIGRLVVAMTASVLCTLAGVALFAPLHVASALLPARRIAAPRA